MISVKSSFVAEVGYENGTLGVRLIDGKRYDYFPVSEETFEKFLNAPSKGIFLNKHVKPFCEYRRLN